MNVYGFSDIIFNDEGGASIIVERRGAFYPVPIITPEPGQKLEDFYVSEAHYASDTPPTGILVTQADGEQVWVFVLHGRLFATKDLNANPHALWLSWAFSRPHFVQRFTGLKPKSGRGCMYPHLSVREHIDTETMKQRTITTATSCDRQYELGPAVKFRMVGEPLQRVDDPNSRTWKRVTPRAVRLRGRRLRELGLGGVAARAAYYGA